MTRFHLFIASALLAAGPLAHAGFSIQGTRVIYHEAQGEAVVHLQRTSGSAPVLLQSWLDDGEPNAKPGSQKLPFILTPAVARVDPNQAQRIRIFRTGDDLPGDRETLLFFNALEVPPPAGAELAGENYLQLAMQARMKFFYRPRGLKPSAAQAAELLDFSLRDARNTDDAAAILHIDNPTPYHITLPRLTLHAAEDAPALAQIREGGIAPMVAPFASLEVALYAATPEGSAQTVLAGLGASTQVHYQFINDQGGFNAKQKALKALSNMSHKGQDHAH